MAEAARFRPASPRAEEPRHEPPAEPSTPERPRTTHGRREGPVAAVPRAAAAGDSTVALRETAAGTRPDDRAPPTPRVHIGTVDVVVTAPEPTRAPSAPARRDGLASRLYLRRL